MQSGRGLNFLPKAALCLNFNGSARLVGYFKKLIREFKVKKAGLGMALCILFACGKIDKQESKTEPLPDSDNSAPVVPPDAVAVANLTAASTCTANIEGRLVYARDVNALYVCTNGKWDPVLPIALASDRLRVSVYCQMMAPQEALIAAGLDKAPVGGLHFLYTVNQFGDGSAFVQARISTASQSYSSAMFWHPRQENSSKFPSQQIILDLSGEPDFGVWEFRMDSLLTGDSANTVAVVYGDDKLDGDRVLAFDQTKDCTSLDFEAKN
jgi:hypothetical protein